MENFNKIKSQCKSIADTGANFHSEKKCIELLIQLRWNGKPTCPNKQCNKQECYYMQNRRTFKCRSCKKQFSIRQGTIFANSNVSLYKWFLAMFFFANQKRGISSIQLAKNIGVQQKTAWLMLHKIRECISDENNILLDGIVEVDEAYCGAKLSRDKRLAARKIEKRNLRIQMDAEGEKEKADRIKRQKDDDSNSEKQKIDDSSHTHFQNPLFEDKRSRMLHYQPLHYRKNIFGIIERDLIGINVFGNEKVFRKGRSSLSKLGRQKGDVNRKNIVPLLEKFVKKDSIVITDECPVYKNLDEHFKKHHSVNHSKKSRKKNKGVQYVVEDQKTGLQVTTNRIENVWNHLKKTENGTYFHFSWKYTDRYLNEIAFRWNNQTLDTSQMFLKLLGKGLCGISLTRKELVKVNDEYYFIAG